MFENCLPKARYSLFAASLLLQFASPGAMAQTATINPSTTYQVISGFGGHNGAGWIPTLTAAQVETAFGNGPGEIGLTIMRMRIDSSSTQWPQQVSAAQFAKAKGAKLFATPWSPPAYMKTSNSLIHGSLIPSYYPDYATHLLDFAAYMKSNGAELYAISIQNEPDYDPSYEGCQWTSQQFIDFLNSQGSRFGSLKVMAAESYSFKKTLTDPILNDAGAAAKLSIVAGHLYGTTPSDYPLATSKGKQVWSTEHYTDSASDANDWTAALPVGVELHRAMAANYSAYVWWYIRRSYGLLTEDGNVSKRGYIMSQYAKYIRPGYTRIDATVKPWYDVLLTSYKGGDGKMVMVAVNNGVYQRHVDFSFASNAPSTFWKYSTTASLNNAYTGESIVVNGATSADLAPLSVTTFVSQPTVNDATGSVKIAQSGLTVNRFTGQFNGTVSFTNTTATPISGSTLQFELEGLSSGVTLDNKSGEVNGIPYITLPGTTIVPGATVSVQTLFGNPSKGTIAYTPKLYSITY